MPKLRSIVLAIAFPALLAAQAPAPTAPEAKTPAKHHRHAKSKGFVGCTATKLFHRPDCAHVADIEKAGTKVMFTNRAEAVQAGYKPCEDCKP
jgi:hypothetical protein